MGALVAAAFALLAPAPRVTADVVQPAAPPIPAPPRPDTPPRIASYDIDAALDDASRAIDGTATITWRNPGTVSTDVVRLHLYWNAWRNTSSTWLRQQALAGLDEEMLERPPADYGWQTITDLRLIEADGSTGADILPTLHFVQPDDGNVDDRSLAEATLPAAVAPGEELRLRVSWRAHVPRTFSRTGVIGQYYFLAHWFPKLGAFGPDGWKARQFFANTEFFADFGRYDVRLTVPRGWTVGATGQEISRADGPGGTTIHHYAQDDVHDFAWTTSPDFVESVRVFEHDGLPPVRMRLLLQPEHLGQEDRHFAATAAALRYYGEWYSPYSYPQITIVDPAWQSGSGGMEYPTIFTAGSRWLAPRQSNQPEAVTVHEAGHQFWYGMVANNEVTDAWMDEGLNTFSEERVQSLAFTPNLRVDRFFGGFVPWQYRHIPLSRETDGNGLNGYRAAAERDVPATPTFRYWPGTHAAISYSKTALWLHTLERHLGWERLQPALRAYAERWRFRHPVPDALFAAINETTGEDLTWFFDEVYRSSDTFDYAAERLDSRPVVARGYFEPASGGAPVFEERRTDGRFRTTVVVRRLGEAIFPVDVLVRFENGEQTRERWDGRARWQAFEYETPARAVSVHVDPERVLLLDVDYTNNSITLAPQAEAAADRWTLAWMVWLQDLLMTWAFFV